ncbi:MAG TPA: diacylglycerol kinase family protein [Tepidisphaeraceae bacterium]|nr:diacylglycerol kinase family protein [Tepidisphaeraceae bacterium]
MKAIAFINAAAGSDASGDERRVHDALAAAGVDATVHAVDAQHLVGATQDALTQHPDLIIAGGGDGTLSTVASILADTGIPLGVLPLGTLNHFAKDLNLPLELEPAARVIAARNIHPVDLGEVNGRCFINNSSIGIYPKIVRARVEHQRLGRGKWLSLAVAVLHVFGRIPRYRVRLNLDGQEDIRTTPFLFVGNNRYQINPSEFGGRTALDHGELCLYLAENISRFAMLRLLLRSAIGRLEQSPHFESCYLRELWIDTGRPLVDVAIDGEVTHMSTPLHYRIRPAALRVIAP